MDIMLNYYVNPTSAVVRCAASNVRRRPSHTRRRAAGAAPCSSWCGGLAGALRRRARRRLGFSLVEVIIATIIFGTAALVATSLISAQYSMMRRTDEHTYVTRILESRLEEVRDLTFDQILAAPASSTFVPHPAVSIFGQAVNPAAANWAYEKDLANAVGNIFIDPVDTDLVRITVEVRWTQATTGRTASRTAATLVSREGVNRR